MAADLAGLKSFVELGAGVEPPVFVGREGALSDIETVTGNIWKSFGQHAQGPRKNARVLYGAPGSGKSSTLAHLESRWNGKQGPATRGTPLMLNLVPSEMDDTARVARKLGNLLAAGLGTTARELRTSVQNWRVNLGVGQVGGESKIHAPPPEDPIEAVLQHFPGEKWTRPVVIAVDEFQNMRGDKHSGLAKMLFNLHESRYRAPVTLVVAGLGDTKTRLDQCGISRVLDQAKHSLGCFSRDETRDLVTGWRDHYGLRPGEWQDGVLALTREANNYPVHVHNVLASFAGEMVRVNGNTALVRIDRVRMCATDLRLGYYRDRMSPEMKKSELLLGMVMQELHPGMGVGTVINLVNRHARPGDDDVRWQLPRGMEAEDYYDHLVHRGALHEDVDDSIVCPIPSFRDWMIANAARHAPETCNTVPVQEEGWRPGAP